MVAAGVPTYRADHAQALARMALEVRDYVREMSFLGNQINFRMA